MLTHLSDFPASSLGDLSDRQIFWQTSGAGQLVCFTAGLFCNSCPMPAVFFVLAHLPQAEYLYIFSCAIVLWSLGFADSTTEKVSCLTWG